MIGEITPLCAYMFCVHTLSTYGLYDFVLLIGVYVHLVNIQYITSLTDCFKTNGISLHALKPHIHKICSLVP